MGVLIGEMKVDKGMWKKALWFYRGMIIDTCKWVIRADKVFYLLLSGSASTSEPPEGKTGDKGAGGYTGLQPGAITPDPRDKDDE